MHVFKFNTDRRGQYAANGFNRLTAFLMLGLSGRSNFRHRVDVFARLYADAVPLRKRPSIKAKRVQVRAGKQYVFWKCAAKGKPPSFRRFGARRNLSASCTLSSRR